ncbi:MAG: ABC transporter ATP-binding protein [Methanotrichaceae archaeon]
MLEIEDLWTSVGSKQILKGINMRVGIGETHAIFGPNGCGKTTLLSTIAGIPRYVVNKGKIVFKGEDITQMPMYERAQLGIGIAFQHPPTIRGVTVQDLIKLCNSQADVDEILRILDFENFKNREVNKGFSGGEVKRSELVQLLAQEPDFAMLDEPDSGVDLENIKLIGKAINHLTQKDLKPSRRTKSGITITHFGHILDYMMTDRAHVMIDGIIACSGNPAEILTQIKMNGYKGGVECVQIRIPSHKSKR